MHHSLFPPTQFNVRIGVAERKNRLDRLWCLFSPIRLKYFFLYTLNCLGGIVVDSEIFNTKSKQTNHLHNIRLKSKIKNMLLNTNYLDSN